MSQFMGDDGGSAFPVVNENGLGHVSNGMTLRDYFAAKAMQGFLAEAANQRFGTSTEPPHAAHWPAFASDAYALADAMLAARCKGEKA